MCKYVKIALLKQVFPELKGTNRLEKICIGQMALGQQKVVLGATFKSYQVPLYDVRGKKK